MTKKPTLEAEPTNTPPPENSGAVEAESNQQNSPKRSHLFQPGVSGNPGGRPKGDATARAHVRNLSLAVVDRMWALANDPKTPVSEARRLLYDLWVFAWGRPESVVKQRLVGQPAAPAGPFVNITMSNPGATALSPAQARAILRRPRDATPAQVEAAETVIYREAERAALPSPAATLAIESTAENQGDLPSNVVQLGTRIDQEPAE